MYLKAEKVNKKQSQREQLTKKEIGENGEKGKQVKYQQIILWE